MSPRKSQRTPKKIIDHADNENQVADCNQKKTSSPLCRRRLNMAAKISMEKSCETPTVLSNNSSEFYEITNHMDYDNCDDDSETEDEQGAETSDTRQYVKDTLFTLKQSNIHDNSDTEDDLIESLHKLDTSENGNFYEPSDGLNNLADEYFMAQSSRSKVSKHSFSTVLNELILNECEIDDLIKSDYVALSEEFKLKTALSDKEGAKLYHSMM